MPPIVVEANKAFAGISPSRPTTSGIVAASAGAKKLGDSRDQKRNRQQDDKGFGQKRQRYDQ
jgi:hypothetical protein